jgi:hypothetical protein
MSILKWVDIGHKYKSAFLLFQPYVILKFINIAIKKGLGHQMDWAMIDKYG